jgi:uncharacterized membrane protein
VLSGGVHFFKEDGLRVLVSTGVGAAVWSAAGVLAGAVPLEKLRTLFNRADTFLPAAIIGVFALAAAAWFFVRPKSFQAASERFATRFEHLSPSVHRAILAVVLICAGILLCFLKLHQYRLLQTAAFDHGIEANVSWNVVHGNGFYGSIHDMNYLGDHFSPVHVFTGLLYYVWEDAAVLLVLQSVAMVIGAWGLYALATKLTGSPLLSLLLCLSYLSNPYLHIINRFDYHPIALVIPVYLWMLYFMRERRWVVFFVLTTLALSIKENVPLELSGLALFMCVRREYRWAGAALLAVCATAFVLEVRVIMPMAFKNHELVNIARFSNFGKTFGEVLHNLLFNPVLVLKNTVLDGGKLLALFLFFLSAGFLPVFSGAVLFTTAFPLALNMLSVYEPQWMLVGQYSAGVLPFLFYSAAVGTLNLRAFLQRRYDPGRAFVLTALVLTAVIGSGLAAVTTFLPYYKTPSTTAHIEEFYKISRSFQTHASVCAHTTLVPHLAMRRSVYLFNWKRCEEADYIVVDIDNDIYWSFESKGKYLEEVARVLKKGDYGVTHNSNGIIVMKRGQATALNGEAVEGILRGR